MEQDKQSLYKKKKLAVIGGSYLQLPLVKKAQQMNLEVHCFAWKEGAVCATIADYFYPISIVNKEEILAKCKQVGIHGVVTIASDLAVSTVNYIANQLDLISNPFKFTEMTTNKLLMRSAFFQKKVSSPRYIKCVENYSQKIEENIINQLTFPLIVKPTDRSGSRGVEKIDSKFFLQEAIDRAMKESFIKEVIIEEFVEGSEVSVESISWEGVHYILAITDKETTGAPFFVELAHHQPSSLSVKIQEKIRKTTIEALDALNIRYGASHTELKIKSDRDVKVIEVGARMGGDFIGSDLVTLSTGYDFLKGVIQVALGEFCKPTHKIDQKDKYAGVYFLSKETAYLKPIIENYSLLKDKYIVKAEITDENLHCIESSADRSGYLIYYANKRIFYGK